MKMFMAIPARKVRWLAPFAALSISAGCSTPGASPMLSQAREQGARLASACAGRDGWSDAAAPARIHGNSWYVGTCGISVVLVTSPNGHVLIDGATAEAVPSILANVRALGFDPQDIKVIIGSHEHIDHMGGFAALKAATGARLIVRAPARAALETGKPDASDPQAGLLPDMAPVRVDRTIGHMEQLADVQGLNLTAHATPGHTSGGTSWTWQSCEGQDCVSIAFVDSMSAISRDDYRFSDHPERVEPFRKTFAVVSALPCDILVTPHPEVSNLFERLAGMAPLKEKGGCRTLATEMRERLAKRLKNEARP